MIQKIFILIFFLASLHVMGQKRTLITDQAYIRENMVMAGQPVDSITLQVRNDPNSVPTNAAVYQAIQNATPNINYYNGITEHEVGVGLGGALDFPTTIQVSASKSLLFVNDNASQLLSVANSTIQTVTDVNNNRTTMAVGQGFYSLGAVSLDDTLMLTVAPNEFTLEDRRQSKKGIQYINGDDDQLVSNSLVPKSYVDAMVGAVSLDAPITEVNANANASTFTILPVDCSGGAITVTPPAGPHTAGDWFAVSDSRAQADTNNITVGFNNAGENLHGTSQDYILNSKAAFARFTYVDATVGWIITH